MSKRQEERYPCVGIELMFSPVRDECVEDLGSEIYSAIAHDMSFSGLSFDVTKPLDNGHKLYILVSNQFQPAERLTAEVRWCKSLENGNYRIGVSILESAGIEFDENNRVDDLISATDRLAPSEARLVCPSCTEEATFTFVENQPGDWEEGIMPLYRCSFCSTTRSIPNILEFNRRFRISELKSNKTVFVVNTPESKDYGELKRILYLEDEPDIQTVAQMALEMVGGYSVMVCSSGKEALANAVDFKPDLFLLDVMVPELTGPQTLEQLRLQKQFKSTPAIFMTAKVQTHEVGEYEADFVLGVIPKPFDPMALSAEISSLWYGSK